MAEFTGLHLHEDLPLFREAINFTVARTGFNARLIERDYFCTLLLVYFARYGGDGLVFKGGTCLAKVHAGFYRLSEDLDFTIPLPITANRSVRRQAVAVIKNAVDGVANYISGFAVTGPLKGANNSTQYNGCIRYRSPTSGQYENVLIEISVREPLLVPVEDAPAKTLLLDPLNGNAAVSDVPVRCIAMHEALAEKFRAAMSRKDAAIRDFFDLDYASQHLGLDPTNPQLVELVRRKMAVPGNLPVDISPERFAFLKRQLDTRLKAVLRDKEFAAFDLRRSFELVVAMAKRVT
jgi:predicted nucleotidyltransferase component of viral defense system